MKFTFTFFALACIATSWAIQERKADEAKDKREAPVGYPSHGHPSQSYQAPSLHEDASSISVGAGYSVGGAKPSYSFVGHGSGAPLQISSESLPSSGHASIQLAPITLQPSHGGLVSNDLSQLMKQLSQSLNSGAYTLQSPSGLEGSYQIGGQNAHGGQEIAVPQLSYGTPQFQQYISEQPIQSVPSYASGTKGLGSYSSTGPVLFSPTESQVSQGHAQPQLSYGAPSSGHSFGDAGAFPLGGTAHSLGGLSSGGSAHALGGLSSGGSGHSFTGLSSGGSAHSLAGFSSGGPGHSFGGSYKSVGSSYIVPSKNSFKPSAFLGASVQSDSLHGLSSLSGSHGAPSFGSSHSLSGSHSGLSLGTGGHGGSFGSLGGFGGGSSKYIAQSYIPAKSEGFGSSLDSIQGFASSGHISSPTGTTYGVPSGSYSSSGAHAASSTNPQYYVMHTKHSSPSFGEGGSSYRGPSTGHGSLNSFSSGSKYSFGGHSSPSSRYGLPKEIHGAHSETTYNTIKYSEELKPHVH